MTAHRDHLTVPAADRVAAAPLVAHLFDAPCTAEGGIGPFSAVHLHDGLTLDFDPWAPPVPRLHVAIRVEPAAFDAILGRIRAAGLAHRSTPNGPDNGRVNGAFGGRLVDWSEPDGHTWEFLTVRYPRPADATGGTP
jgi:hypothetical protein